MTQGIRSSKREILNGRKTNLKISLCPLPKSFAYHLKSIDILTFHFSFMTRTSSETNPSVALHGIEVTRSPFNFSRLPLQSVVKILRGIHSNRRTALRSTYQGEMNTWIEFGVSRASFTSKITPSINRYTYTN